MIVDGLMGNVRMMQILRFIVAGFVVKLFVLTLVVTTKTCFAVSL